MQNKNTPLPHWLASCKHTPMGEITCVVSERGLTHVFFEAPDEARQELNLPDQSSTPPEAQDLLNEALRQVAAYLHAELKRFDLPIDLRACTEFQRRVLEEVCQIPYGQVMTYGQIAERVGGPRTVRAVGGAVGGNPLPLVIPCHRVVSTGGHLRGYSGRGGVRTKAWLLQMEGHFLVSEELE